MKEKILQILKETGDFISGEKISRSLGISRTAVWKHIQSLKQEGYSIVSEHLRGYCLKKSPDSLHPTELTPLLKTRVFGRKIHYVKETVSTNSTARRLAEEGAPEGTLVISETQLEGRGRLGRQWSSPSGGIWLSLILRPPTSLYYVSAHTLLIAVALTQSINALKNVTACIKWPNDVLIHQHKVAGILTEISAEMDRVNYLVAGVGINANFTEDALPPELKGKATTLLTTFGQPLKRSEFTANFLKAWEEHYCAALSAGFEDVLSLWRRHSSTLGNHVILQAGDRQARGVAVDIDERGGLVLETTAEGRKVFLAGEVTGKTGEAESTTEGGSTGY